MPEPLRHVSPNDPISAAAWNAIVDGLRGSNERIAQVGKRPGENSLFWQRSIVQMRNSSSGDRSQFDVLGISGSIFTAGDTAYLEFPRLEGVAPVAGTHEGKFAILLEPVNHLAVARAVVAGVTIAQVDMIREGDQWADIDDGECGHLESRPDPGSAWILTVETGTGVKWAIVRIAPVTQAIRRFELDETLSEGSNATAHLVQIDDQGAVTEDEATTFEVYDPFSIFSGEAGDRGYAAYFGDSTHWEIIQMVC